MITSFFKNRALFAAIDDGDLAGVIAALDRGANPAACGRQGESPLMAAVRGGQTAIVDHLLNRAGVTLGEHSRYALPAAIETGNSEIVGLLIAAGADLENGCREWDGGRMSRLTPLMQASRNGHMRIAALLLAAGADINARNDFDQTALMYAVQGQHEDCVKMLLQAGAKTVTRNKQGDDAKGLAQRLRYEHIADILRDEEMRRALRDRAQQENAEKSAEVRAGDFARESAYCVSRERRFFKDKVHLREVFDFSARRHHVISRAHDGGYSHEIRNFSQIRQLDDIHEAYAAHLQMGGEPIDWRSEKIMPKQKVHLDDIRKRP